MTDKIQYQKLKQVIHKVNPSILELKFGCEITIGTPYEKHDLWWEKYTIVSVKHCVMNQIAPSEIMLNNNKIYTTTSSGDGCWQNEYSTKGAWKIIGTPITLCDVLGAIDESDYEFEISVNQGGVFSTNRLGTHWNYSWNLSHNSLDNQSDETKQFLIDLLVK